MRQAVREALERVHDTPLRNAADGLPLITSLGIIEGEILIALERDGALTLRELTRALTWPARLIMMAVGGLVREHLIQVTQFERDLVIEPTQAVADVTVADEPVTQEAVPEVWGG